MCVFVVSVINWVGFGIKTSPSGLFVILYVNVGTNL